MNAIAFNPEKGIVDPFGGEEDIKKGIIRCVGEPDKRFNEDGLRILRALRFASRTGFEIEEETAKSVFNNKNLIKNISSERIFAEFKKLLCGRYAQNILDEYKEVVAVFLPEILPIAGFEQNTKYHYLDVYGHTLAALKNSEPDEIIRLAVFLHDIGKPAAFYADEDGTAHFKGHAAIGAKIARDIFKRLKSDKKTADMVCGLIELHSERITPNNVNIKKLISEKGFEFVNLLIKLKRADASAKAPLFRDTSELDEAERMVLQFEADKEPVFLSDLDISGADIIQLGAKGKKIGEILMKLLYAVHCGEIDNCHSKLMKKAEEILTNEKD